MKQTTFVTGATGFVGFHLAKRLSEQGYLVHCLVRKSSNTTRLKNLKNIKLHTADLTDFKKLHQTLSKINPQFIFHCAASGIHGGIEDSPKVTLESNLVGTLNLLLAAEPIKYQLFVNTGSSSEYGIRESKMKEGDDCHPESVYAIAKYGVSLFCSQYAKSHNKPVITLRIFSPYGPLDSPDRFISYLVKAVKNNEKISIENPNAVRDYIYIDDVISAYLQCIKKRKKIRGEIINIGSGKQIRVQEVIDILKKNLKIQPKLILKSKKRRYESKKWEADITKASKLLNWKPLVSIEEGLKKTLQAL